MKKHIWICLASASLGAVVATAYHNAAPWREASAQESSRRTNSSFIPQPQLPGTPISEAPSLPQLPSNAYSPGGPSLAPAAAGNDAPHTVFPPPSSASLPGTGLEEFTPEERTNILAYERSNRSVVHITTKSAQTAMLFIEVPAEGTGSGSVLDRQGHILTNYHVVEGAQEIRVTLFDGESYPASLVGRDIVNDIAVLRISAPEASLIPMPLGESSRLRVGQFVYAIGNPFGLERTMTTGIISSLNRSLPSKSGRTMKSIIQIDAALNRGNSGGPLLDSHGRLIGMNTAIASSTGENTGIGFAIPVDSIRRVVPQLIEHGRVIRPDSGITAVHQTELGLVIATLTPGGAAERAGLRGFRIVKEQKRRGPFTVEERKIDRTAADTIVAVDGEKVRTADEFLSYIERHRPGELAMLSVLRDGQRIEVPLPLSPGE
jgi:S1-C subfamily serine protease